MDTFAEETKIVASKDQVSGELDDGEMVILNLKDGVYYGLNPVGSRILSLIQEPRSVGEIRDILLAEYDVEPEICIRELKALLQEMADRDLIKVT